MPEQTEDTGREQPSGALDLKKFTMNEMHEDRAQDPDAFAKTVLRIAFWLVLIAFLGFAAANLKQYSQRRGSYKPDETTMSADSEFEQSVINRSPVLMVLVAEVRLGGAGEVQYLGADGQIHQKKVDRVLQAVLNSTTTSGSQGAERPTVEKDWTLAGQTLMKRFEEFCPGQNLAVSLIREGKPVGNLVYDKTTKQIEGVVSSHLAAPPPASDEHGHAH